MPITDYLRELEASLPQSSRICTRASTLRAFSDAHGRVEIALTFSTFPNHKHVPEGIVAVQRPSLADVVAEALAHVVTGTLIGKAES